VLISILLKTLNHSWELTSCVWPIYAEYQAPITQYNPSPTLSMYNACNNKHLPSRHTALLTATSYEAFKHSQESREPG